MKIVASGFIALSLLASAVAPVVAAPGDTHQPAEGRDPGQTSPR